nr:glycosyltransferase family 39 protein [uncultured Lacibacter sp.]
MPRLLTNIVLLITVVCCSLFYFLHGRKSTVFYGDALGYYLYLPATFIYGNHGQYNQLPPDKEIGQGIFNYTADMNTLLPKSPKGFTVNQYTYGAAAFEFPFFITAHLFEKITGRKANGFSSTYENAIRLAGIFYLLVGLFFLFKSLQEFVNRNTAIITCCFLLIGTNLFWFSFYQSGMAHVVLFFLYAALLYFTIQVHKQQKLVSFIAIGLAVGFITVIRPSDILCLLLPVCYSVYNRSTLQQKIQLLQRNKANILIAAVYFVLPFVPQLIYWKQYAGSFFYDSYVGQSFDFLHPKIIAGVFGFKNGWLAYTPLMILALCGLFLYKKFKTISLSIFLILPVYMYVIYSWWSYNYINGFGSRPMIHLYPLLAIPFAVLLNAAVSKGKAATAGLLTAVVFCTFINIKQSVQQAKGEMWSEDSNAAFNLQTLFKRQLDYNDLVAADNGQHQPSSTVLTTTKAQQLNFSDSVAKTDHITITAEQEYSPAAVKLFATTADEKAKWIKASGYFNSPEQIYDWYRYHLLVVTVTRNGELLLWQSIKINNKIGIADSSCKEHDRINLRHADVNQWGHVYFYVPLQVQLQKGDEVTALVWNMARKSLLVKQLKLELLR